MSGQGSLRSSRQTKRRRLTVITDDQQIAGRAMEIHAFDVKTRKRCHLLGALGVG